MSSFNQLILMGNTTRDVEIRQLPGGTVVGSFGFAVNSKYRTKDGEEREDVLFIDCEAWGRTAETLLQYAPKGKALLLCGSLRFETWQDKDGGKRSKHKMRIDNFQFTGSREGGGGEEQDRPRAKNTLGQPGPSSKAYQNAKAGARTGLPDAPRTEQGGDFDLSDVPF